MDVNNISVAATVKCTPNKKDISSGSLTNGWMKQPVVQDARHSCFCWVSH